MARRSPWSLATAFLLILSAGPAWTAPKKGPSPVGSPFPISDCPQCAEGAPFVAGNPDGRFFALWATWAGAETRLRARSFDLAGGRGVEMALGEDRDAGPAGVVASPVDGSFTAVWLYPNRIHLQRFSAQGDAGPPPVLVTSAPSGDDDNPWLAAREDGSLVLVFGRTLGTQQPGEVRALLLSSGATPQGSSTVVETTYGRSLPVVCAQPGGSAVLVWSTQSQPSPSGTVPRRNVALRRISASGALEGSTLQLGTAEDESLSLGQTVACAPDGSFAVAWHTRLRPARKGNDIVLRLFGSQGQPLVSILPNLVKGEQTDPALLYEPGRGWLVAWVGRDRGRSEIRGRRYSLTGRALGREVVLYRAARGRRVDYPALAAGGSGGGFVLSWVEDERAFGQLFKP